MLLWKKMNLFEFAFMYIDVKSILRMKEKIANKLNFLKIDFFFRLINFYKAIFLLVEGFQDGT